MFSFFKRKPNPELEQNGSHTRAAALWKEGSRMMERKKYDRALAAMREALELEPARLDGRLNIGAALYMSGEHTEAVTHLKYVLAFEPQNTVALLNLAACYDALGQMEESIAALEKLVADRPQWRDAHYNLAVAYYKQNSYEKAIEALRTELRLNPGHEAARTLLNKISLSMPHNADRALHGGIER